MSSTETKSKSKILPADKIQMPAGDISQGAGWFVQPVQKVRRKRAPKPQLSAADEASLKAFARSWSF